MTLTQIYENYTPGSRGFAGAVRDHTGFGLSMNEIIRISKVAKNAAEFGEVWANEDWWTDKVQLSDNSKAESRG